jgi:hypothetical protein
MEEGVWPGRTREVPELVWKRVLNDKEEVVREARVVSAGVLGAEGVARVVVCWGVELEVAIERSSREEDVKIELRAELGKTWERPELSELGCDMDILNADALVKTCEFVCEVPKLVEEGKV